MVSKNSHSYSIGFEDGQNIEEVTNLGITGTIPEWLRGSLFRTSPGKFHFGKDTLPHWFDGLSLIHKVEIHKNNASYVARFVESNDYIESTEKKAITHQNFSVGPKKGIFGKLSSLLKPKVTDNPNVNMVFFDNELLVLGELTDNFQIDYDTLETVKPVRRKHHSKTKGFSDIAHPQYDPITKEYINFGVKFGAKTEYYLYTLAKKEDEKKVFWKKKVDSMSYIHSFGLTPDYVVLVECPLHAKPLDIVFSSFLDALKWKSDVQTRFTLIHRKTGEEQNFEGNPFFFFHIANAFQTNEGVSIDICSYPEPNTILEDFTMDHLKHKDLNLHQGSLKRYTLPFGETRAREQQLSKENIDFPKVNMLTSWNEPNYDTVYGAGQSKNATFIDRLLKLDTSTGDMLEWKESDQYPGEPILITNGDSSGESVLISVVLNAEAKHSYILILDSETMKEHARITLPVVVPFGFHGTFVKA